LHAVESQPAWHNNLIEQRANDDQRFRSLSAAKMVQAYHQVFSPHLVKAQKDDEQ
jgi:hypothetical protein